MTKIIPRDYQLQLMDMVRDALRSGRRRPLVVAATGSGKCLAKGTPVLMFDGAVRPVEDVAVGDLLMGPDSKPRRVESLARGREQMFRVTPVKGDAYTVNESHVLSLRNDRGLVKNISVRDYLTEPPHWRSRNHGWRVPGVLRGDTTPVLVEISVDPVGVGDYYGFEISGPDRLFLLGDFTVTHNTVVFSAIAASAAARSKRVLILAHRDTLIKQASGKLRDYDVPHGIIMAGFTPNMRAMVQVGSVQTLVRRLDKMRWRPDLIIVDEAHLSAAKSYLDIIDHYSEAVVIGFTGSPCRLDGKSLGSDSGGIYDDLIQAISIRELIERDFLVRPVVYAPAEQLDLSGIKKSMGDFDTKALAAVVDKPKLIGDAVNQYRRICNGVPAVAWCVTVAHAEHVANEFNAAGIPAEMLCGDHDTGHRDAVLKKLETGAVKVVTFVGILVEGVDCPAIGAVIMLRPTMSLASYLQVVGRGLRPHVYRDGRKKDACYVIDHAGLTFKHGFADEERDWELNGDVKKKRKKKADDEPTLPVVQCHKCYACFRPADVCPHCGEPVPVRERKVEVVDGDLHEITREMAEAMRKSRKTEVGKARTLEDLQRIAAERGYKPGWARQVFESRTRRRAPPRPPEPTMDELLAMSLAELENVSAAQGWPAEWASNFYHDNRRAGAA